MALTKISKQLDVPIWNGEIGAHKIEWVGAVINMFEDPSYNVSGWIFWPWKRVPEPGKRYRHLMEIKSTPKWDMVRNWVAGVIFAPKPSRQDALEGMRGFIEAIITEKLIVDEDMKNVLTAFKGN